jgi:hypothetical protein
MKIEKNIPIFIDTLLLMSLVAFLMIYFDIRYLFYDTVVTGGDTASWHGIAHHLAHVLLPAGRLTGWDMGNFCGYPNFNFYFLPPFLLAVIPANLLGIPMTIALKWAIMSGIFLFPIFTFFGLRCMGYRFPVPITGAAGAVLFIFNETYTMFGGNALSTFAGEFCYMFAVSLFALFIGTFYKGIEKETGLILNGALLGLIGLCHLFVFIPALLLPLFGFLIGVRLRYLLGVCLIAFICMAFWILPLVAFRHPYTTPVYMIWQNFVNLRYTLAGILIIILFIGPRYAVHTIAATADAKPYHEIAFLILSVSGVIAASYLLGKYLVLGKDLWLTGLQTPGYSDAPLGEVFSKWLTPWILPISLTVGAVTGGIGMRTRMKGSFVRFMRIAGALCVFGLLFPFLLKYHGFITRAVEAVSLRHVLLNRWLIWGIYGSFCLGIASFLVVSKAFNRYLHRIASDIPVKRFYLWSLLVMGCAVAYFSAHFLQVPDIRFLPPLGFALLMIIFAETLGPFVEQRKILIKTATAVTVCYVTIVIVLFGARKSESWYRFNNKGYEMTSGYPEFIRLNRHLKTVYEKKGLDPLNAPRVAYEKSDQYGRYGGDRVFESLPFFSGRQTLEGIHYASSLASPFMAFIQTEFSKEVKTPKPQILSKINPEALPAHFDLYNISQLVVVTDTLKRALSDSTQFEKEAQFGKIWLFRYIGCSGRYVDIPKVQPVVYTGSRWVDDFFAWYKDSRRSDVLLVPERYVKDKADRATLSEITENVFDLDPFRSKELNRDGLQINSHMEHLQIRFTTNKVGIPHLIKVSYFPNWSAEGANGVYPVSPHLMLVIPREKTVILKYGNSWFEIVGIIITAGGIIILLIVGVFRFSKLRSPHCLIKTRQSMGDLWTAMERFIDKIRRPFVALVIVLAVGLIVAGAWLRNIPVRTYIAGYQAFSRGLDAQNKGDSQQAEQAFDSAIDIMKPLLTHRRRHDHRDAINALLTTAMCYENLKAYESAETWYQTLLREYPYSRYVAEGYVRLARIYRRKMDAPWQKGLKRLQQGFDTGGQKLRLVALEWLEKSLQHYQLALQEEPYSIWIEYAREDFTAIEKFLASTKTQLLSFPNDSETRRRLHLLSLELKKLNNTNSFSE